MHPSCVGGFFDGTPGTDGGAGTGGPAGANAAAGTPGGGGGGGLFGGGGGGSGAKCVPPGPFAGGGSGGGGSSLVPAGGSLTDAVRAGNGLITITYTDAVAPVAAPTQAPAANASGWNNTAVTVTWNWTDDGAGVDPTGVHAVDDVNR